MAALLADITVNGERISTDAIAQEAQLHPAPKGKPGIAWRAAGKALAIRALLLQEARRQGLAPEPRNSGPSERETDEEALIRQLFDISIDPKAPGKAEVRAAYDEDPSRWRAPTLYEAAHILFPVRPGDSEALVQANLKATAALQELARSPRAFDQLAREMSACSSRDNGGRLGQITSGDTVPEFEAVLDRLAEGEISSAPVATRFGLHIIRLDARAEGAILPFASVEAGIRAALGKAAWTTAALAFIARLAESAEVVGIDLMAA